MTLRANPPGRQYQKGVALIMVLLAMALVVTLIGGMTQHQALRVYKATDQMTRVQGKGIAFGAEAFAQQILIQDLDKDEEDGKRVDGPEEVWARNAAVIPVEEGQGVVEVQINDLGGKLNLNDLVNVDGTVNTRVQEQFDRLLGALEIREVRTPALIDWIDEDRELFNAYGAEDGDYLVLSPPYRAANQPFVSTSELRLIEGMTEKAYQALVPHVTALPVSGAGINVNMASAPVIQSLHEEITRAQAEAIVEQIIDEGAFETVDDFLALPTFAGLGLKPNGLSVRTRFFAVASRITFRDNVYRLVTRMYRGEDGQLSVIDRDEGQRNLITKETFSLSGES